MPIADIIHNINLFYDGNSYMGKIAEMTLPKLAPTLVEHMAGGMSAPVDVPMLAHEKLETEMVLKAFDVPTLKTFNVGLGRPVPLTARGAIQDDDGTKHAVAVQMRGIVKEFDMGTWKAAEEATLKMGLSLRYYRLTYDGADVYEADPINMVFKVNGVDQMTQTRAALGI